MPIIYGIKSSKNIIYNISLFIIFIKDISSYLYILERLLHAKTHIQNKGPEIPYFMKNKIIKKRNIKSRRKKKML